MNPIQEYMHEKVSSDWNNFPWKMDYIFYMIYKNKPQLNNADNIKFKKEKEHYILYQIDNAIMSDIESDFNSLKIDKKELLKYFNIKDITYYEIDFPYTTNIFENPLKFRGQLIQVDSQEYINLKIVIPSKYCSVTQKFITIAPKSDSFNLNEKMEKYSFYYHLNQHTFNKQSLIEKKMKI